MLTYDRSLELLRRAKELQPTYPNKIKLDGWAWRNKRRNFETMDDLRANDVDIMTIGQYLQPSKKHIPVVKYYHPDEFLELKEIAMEKGFSHCESGPLVRSSYHADDQVNAASKTKTSISEKEIKNA